MWFIFWSNKEKSMLTLHKLLCDNSKRYKKVAPKKNESAEKARCARHGVCHPMSSPGGASQCQLDHLELPGDKLDLLGTFGCPGDVTDLASAAGRHWFYAELGGRTRTESVVLKKWASVLKKLRMEKDIHVMAENSCEDCRDESQWIFDCRRYGYDSEEELFGKYVKLGHISDAYL